MPYDLDSRGPQHVVLRVGEGLGGGHHDALPGVDAQRVHIFHVTHLTRREKGGRGGG